MSKRFCDTEIWQKEWFLNLSAVERQLFLYIKDNCDCAGFFVPNYALLSFVMGQKITKEDFKNLKQVVFIKEDVIFLEDFITFQYNVSIEELNPKYSVHRGIIKRLNKYGLFGTLNQPLSNSSASVQDKVKDKDKDKDSSYLQEEEKKEEKEKIKKEKEEKKEIETSEAVENQTIKEEKETKQPEIQYNSRLNDVKNRMKLYVNPDLMYDTDVEKVFFLYEKLCKNLIPLKFEKRDGAIRLKVKEFLEVISGDFSYAEELFKKADSLKVIVDRKIDFLSAINNHSRIVSGFFIPQSDSKEALEDVAKRIQEEIEKEKSQCQTQ